MSHEAKLTFKVDECPPGQDEQELAAALGLGPDDLKELTASTAGDVSLRPGGVGRGAEGPGIAIILSLTDNLVSTVAGLLVLGEALRRVIRKVTAKSEARRPTITEPRTFGAVAAAGARELSDELIGLEFLGSYPLGEPYSRGVGADDREIWYAAFQHPSEGYVLLIFMSPSGVVLGNAKIPYEAYYTGQNWIWRNNEDISSFHQPSRDEATGSP